MTERVPCPACHGEKRVFVETKRLIGATYSFDDPWKGDEHYEPCPFCKGNFFKVVLIKRVDTMSPKEIKKLREQAISQVEEYRYSSQNRKEKNG